MSALNLTVFLRQIEPGDFSKNRITQSYERPIFAYLQYIYGFFFTHDNWFALIDKKVLFENESPKCLAHKN
jgi:hypothetical protein